jgi:hypothetical protein
MIKMGTKNTGKYAPRLIYEFVPRLAAVVDDVVVGGKHPVG